MATLRILHCADLHLDSPLRGLESDPDAPAARIREATRDAVTNLVDLALNEQVRLVLIAGDLYDGDWQDWRTGQFLLRQIERLTRAGVRVVAVRGNHDAQSIITRHLRWPEGAVVLQADHAETKDFPDLGVAVHGRSYARRDVAENLARDYPPPSPGLLNIGLLHTSLTGRPGHDHYAPCAVEQLVAHGYDYWALGHIHEREEVSREPWIVFPGNTQGRHIRETGAKGATLLTVRDGAIATVEHRPLDVVRWAAVEVDLTGADDEDAALARVRRALDEALSAADGRLLAARVTLRGASSAHAALTRDLGDTREKCRNEAIACGGGGVWLEQVAVATVPPHDLAALSERSDSVGLLARAVAAAGAADVATDMRTWAVALLERAPFLRAALGEAHPAVQAASGAIPPAMLEQARALLLARLAES
jgi:DNA repair exonuclease SbcCD nuclease subunit